jgi:thiol-disulfide isomerase/thioredoxin
MKNYNIPIILIIIHLWIGSQAQSNNNKFVLHGKISGRDTGRIRLTYRDMFNNRIRDTTYLQNGNFSFTGYISEPILATIWGGGKTPELYNANQAEVFIEPGSEITTHLVVNEFNHPRTTGSSTQVDWEYLLETENKLSAAKKKYNYRINFINSHPDSYLSPYLLTWYLIQKQISLDSAKLLYSHFNPVVQSSIIGKSLFSTISETEATIIGNTAPFFKRFTNDNKLLSLASFSGKTYVLIDFWASWCAPCRELSPHLKDLYNKYHSKGFEIISISCDTDKKAWQDAIKKDEVGAWYHVLENPATNKKGKKETETQESLRSLFSVLPIPALILIDQNGIITGRYGGYDKSKEGLDERLRQIFK